MKYARVVALVAGFAFYLFSIVLQGIIPAVLPESETSIVSRTIVTPMSFLETVPAVNERRSKSAARGRIIYRREGCWYCHSQYVRPVSREIDRWGPISEAGEYAGDQPHTLGTRRIGPDLTREGGLRGDDWHIAHFYSPRSVVPGSIMPRYSWLIDDEALSKGKTGRELLTRDGSALLDYMQSLGTGRGRWYDEFLRRQSLAFDPVNRVDFKKGRNDYLRHCAGCHGNKGNGRGSVARVMSTKPRDFTSGIYKYKSTPKGQPPLASDLYRSITIGLRGSGMPAWYELEVETRRNLVAYLKTLAPDSFNKEPEQIFDTATLAKSDPGPSGKLIGQGKEVYGRAGCVGCHGAEGRGDGPAASALMDVWGNPVRPANFTLGRFKSGPAVVHVMRTITNGVDGTPMPQFLTALSEKERWAVAYYVWTLSAEDKEKLRAEIDPATADNFGLWYRLVCAWQGKDPLAANVPLEFR